MLSRILFTVVLLALAFLHWCKSLGIDSLSIWLGVLAVVPWILPQLADLISDVSVKGIFAVKFRDLKAKVDAYGLAIEGGVGGKTAANAVPRRVAPEEERPVAPQEEEKAAPVNATDPNKGQFGLQPTRDGFRLSADVQPFPGSDRLFRVDAEVAGIDGAHRLNLGDFVRFFLHPTFPQREVDVKPSAGGTASLERVAWGAFTLGAEVHQIDRPPFRLELDLAHDVPSAPWAFRVR